MQIDSELNDADSLLRWLKPIDPPFTDRHLAPDSGFTGLLEADPLALTGMRLTRAYWRPIHLHSMMLDWLRTR